METGAQDWEVVWRQAKGLFHAALDIEPEQRLQFLQRKGVPKELHDRVVQLLNAHEAADSFMLRDAALAESWIPSDAPPRLSAGDLLAERFEVVRFVARGGMGEVYEARDLELQTSVAIKIIRPKIAAHPAALARFKSEVYFSRQVTHPNVCRIFDLFRHKCTDPTETDVIFVSMELLHGSTLAEWLKVNGRMSPEYALPVLKQVIEGLGAAHAAGVLHRDLKPGNIILETANANGVRAVITDFGLAWRLQADEVMQTEGSLFPFGTPEYMSPEQIEGKELTAASDIYSLGLVIYRMLTGYRAFNEGTPMIAALRRLNELPTPPSQLNAELDKRWDDITARCLHPDPNCRFRSTAEMLTAVQAIGTAPAQKAKQGEKILWQRKWLVSAIAVLLATCAALWAIHSRHHSAPPQSLTYVLANFVNTTGDEVFDNTLNLALETKLQQTPFLQAMPEADIKAALQRMNLNHDERLSENIAREVCQRGHGQVVLQGSIATSAAGYLVGVRAIACGSGKILGASMLPAKSRDEVLTALDRTADNVRPQLGESLDSIHKYDTSLWDSTTASLNALKEFSDGHTAWNEHGEAAAIPYFERAVQIDPNFALAWARLGTVFGNLGENERGQAALRKAFDLRDRVTLWERFYIVSHYYAFVTGEVDKEMKTYEDWAAAYPNNMIWVINLSVDDAISGQPEKAIALQQRAIQNQPGNALCYGNLAQLYLAIGRPDEAKLVLDNASRMHLDDLNIELARYGLDFYQNDVSAMNSIAAGGAHRAGIEDALLAEQAKSKDRLGQLNAGREFAEKAAVSAASAGNMELSAFWLASEAHRQAQMSNTAAARLLMSKAIAASKKKMGWNVQLLLAMAAAETGNTDHAHALLHDAIQSRPLDTIVTRYWLPIISAQIALRENKPELALHSLDAVGQYDLGVFEPGRCMDAGYLRGAALLAEHKSADAAEQFRQLIAHRGFVLNCPTGPLAQLALARALAQSGDLSAARTAYQDLLLLWKDADNGVSLVDEARSEYIALH